MLFNHSILLNHTLLATHNILSKGTPETKVVNETDGELSALAYSVLAADYTPSTFFNNFDFFTDSDPTHGFVKYVDQGTAQGAGLISAPSTDSSPVYIGVDHTNVAPSGRESVRIVSKESFTHGLFLLDVAHMPYGCATWPAWWTVGPNWPNQGEIDIIEGVNTNNYDNMALHTASGCQISGAGSTGQFEQADCNVATNGNAGCGYHNLNTQSYGNDFNNIGGGLYAMEWNSQFIKIWFFPRSAIPSDALGANPEPANWGTPAGFFEGCAIDSYFSAHQIVIDNTFCGDWAGNVWSTDGSCTALSSSCSDFVANNPGQFANAYWLINGLRVFSS